MFGAFSVSLLIAAAIGPRVGRTIDEFGGRAVLMASQSSSLPASRSWRHRSPGRRLGRVAVIFRHGAWLVRAAFAALSRIYGTAARGPITGHQGDAGNRPAGGGPIDAA